MHRLSAAARVGIGCLVIVCSQGAAAREPSFEERVRAQDAIERVYYRHQIGATRAFEEAVPRALLEKKVAAYLERSASLESVRHAPLTQEMLRSELARIRKSTRFPERLAEIEEALHHDADLIAECLARPVLVERLLHGPTDAPDVAAPASGPSPTCTGDDTWNNGILLPEFNPARLGHRAVWTGSVMIVWGGGGLGTGMRYDPLVDAWTPTSSRGAPIGRSAHVAVWTGSRMIVWGGSAPSYTNTGGVYDPVADSWTPTTTAGAPSPRQFASGVWTGTEMIVWGGDNGTAPALTTGGRYNPATNTWLPMSTAGAPVAGVATVSVWSGQRLIVWGGRTLQGGAPSGTGARYDPATDSWTPISTSGAPSGRDDAIAVWTGTRMIVWGGEPGDATGGRYDPVNDTWSPTSVIGAPLGRDFATSVWTGTEMNVWGGGSFPSFDGTGGRYNPVSDSWLPVSTSGAPTPRSGHTAVWTGTRMIVWGGGPQDGSGGRYDPASDTWAPTFVPPPPPSITKRDRATAVWTGNVMIVWGGGDGGSGFPTQAGGRYDPILDAWAPTSLTNAPPARRLHAAVWTGQEMLIWGGLADVPGGRYDPIADSWSPISRTNEPSRRQYHTAIWTGSRMLIWGGQNSEFPPSTEPGCTQASLADGGSYDPATDSWTPITATGSPGRRWQHSAVWTGSRMIVWGGAHHFFNVPLSLCLTQLDNFGGAYDPATNSWTPVTLTGAPTAKYGHNAVWTGTEMIVWGIGTSGTDVLGGRYVPTTDSWTGVSELNAPLRTSVGVGVWTGSEMIVWGTTATNTGGRYTPATDSWTTMTTDDAPPAGLAAGVWTGEAVMVWGERGGGRYFVGRADGDGDGIADTCDLCPLDPANDFDHDGVCGNVDNCPTVANVVQRDSDVDGAGDLCDDCPSISNPSQSDADADGAGDACDCRPSDPTDRKPAQVGSLTVGKAGTTAHLAWTAAAAADAYAVSRGDLATKGAGEYGSCLQQGIAATFLDDATMPAAGQGFFYLVQGQNYGCGLGSLGAASNEQPRSNANPAACQGIVVSDAHASTVSVVSGSGAGTGNTLAPDDAYMTVTEVLSSGSPSSRFSFLEGRFTFTVGTGSVKELHVEGSRTASTDGDDFRFEYSTNGGASFTPVALTLPLSDDDIDRIAALPPTITGSVIIRVVDTDRTAGHQTLDTVAIDEIWIRAVP